MNPSAIERVQSVCDRITHFRNFLEIYSGDRIEFKTFELQQIIEETNDELVDALLKMEKTS